MRELTVFPLPPGSYTRSSGYGPRVHPVTGKPGTFHRGVDYAAPHGTPVFAPWDGFVTTGYEAGGAGNWIWVQAGTDLFKSFHHSGYQVRSGFVHAGDVIAFIGTTGSSTGAHGHFELWDNGRNIDPTQYLNRAPLKGAPAPTPPADLPKGKVMKIIWYQGVAYAVWDLFRRSLSTDDYNTLRYLGTPDVGEIPANLFNVYTDVPRQLKPNDAFIAWQNNISYLFNGSFRKPIGLDELNTMKFLGVRDIGNVPSAFFSSYTELPNKVAGA